MLRRILLVYTFLRCPYSSNEHCRILSPYIYTFFFLRFSLFPILSRVRREKRGAHRRNTAATPIRPFDTVREYFCKSRSRIPFLISIRRRTRTERISFSSFCLACYTTEETPYRSPRSAPRERGPNFATLRQP